MSERLVKDRTQLEEGVWRRTLLVEVRREGAEMWGHAMRAAAEVMAEQSINQCEKSTPNSFQKWFSLEILPVAPVQMGLRRSERVW